MMTADLRDTTEVVKNETSVVPLQFTESSSHINHEDSVSSITGVIPYDSKAVLFGFRQPHRISVLTLCPAYSIITATFRRVFYR